MVVFPQGEFSSIEEVVEAVEKRMRLKLVPIFHRYSKCVSQCYKTSL